MVDINVEGILGVPSCLQLNSLRIFHSFLVVSDPGCSQLCARDNSRINESSSVMVEAYKENQKSRKHTRSTRNIHIDSMQEFKPIYYFCSMKDGGII